MVLFSNSRILNQRTKSTLSLPNAFRFQNRFSLKRFSLKNIASIKNEIIV